LSNHKRIAGIRFAGQERLLGQIPKAEGQRVWISYKSRPWVKVLSPKGWEGGVAIQIALPTSPSSFLDKFRWKEAKWVCKGSVFPGIFFLWREIA